MYATCLHCHGRLGRNEAIEAFPVGRRLAFDAAKGRLWVVCRTCQRWNLTPIEERWEAVENCEELFRAERLRAQTDNIGLAKLREGTELIRIGRPLRPEFAAWRYGAVFRRRLHRRVGVVAAAGTGVVAGALIIAGVPILAGASPLVLFPLVHLGIASVALRGNVVGTKVLGSDGKVLNVTAADLDFTRIIAADDGTMRLQLKHSFGRQELTGDRAVRALAALLVRANRGGGSATAIASAAKMVAEVGTPERMVMVVAREAAERTGDFDERAAAAARGPHARTMAEFVKAQIAEARERAWVNGVPTNPGALHRLPAVSRLALEMSLHESSEQRALDDELGHLEQAWREAEEIAAIADGLLTPVSRGPT